MPGIVSDVLGTLRDGTGGHFVEHAERVDDAAVEEDPAGCVPESHVLLDVAAQDRPRERCWVGPTIGAPRKSFGDDRPRRVPDGRMAQRRECFEHARLACAGAPGPHTPIHGCQHTRTPGEST